MRRERFPHSPGQCGGLPKITSAILGAFLWLEVGLSPAACAAKPPPLIMIRMLDYPTWRERGPVPGWHLEAPTLRAGTGAAGLAGSRSDRLPCDPADPAPGPLKRFQAWLGTPSAELRVQSILILEAKPNWLIPQGPLASAAREASVGSRLQAILGACSGLLLPQFPALGDSGWASFTHCPTWGCSEASSPASPCPR